VDGFMSATPPAQVQIRVDWSAAERLPILAANLVLVQQTPPVILTFGTLAPPVTTTPITPEQAQGMILAAQPVARILLPPGRAVELLNALQQQLALFQQTQQH
jgi:hypothetical protein